MDGRERLKDFAARSLLLKLESRGLMKLPALRVNYRRGWGLGEGTFREELLTQMSERMGAESYGEERAETAEALAEQIIAEELKRGRWQEADLKTRPKGNSVRSNLAARWRAETMTVAVAVHPDVVGKVQFQRWE